MKIRTFLEELAIVLIHYELIYLTLTAWGIGWSKFSKSLDKRLYDFFERWKR